MNGVNELSFDFQTRSVVSECEIIDTDQQANTNNQPEYDTIKGSPKLCTGVTAFYIFNLT
jgi:hypothetical protein